MQAARPEPDPRLLRARTSALRKLKQLGIVSYFTRDVMVRGQLSLNPARLAVVDGLEMGHSHRVEIDTPETVRFCDPSPLSQIGSLPLFEAQSYDQLVDMIAHRWAPCAERALSALKNARQLAPNARLEPGPWRIEGSAKKNYDEVRLLFAPRGDRACVVAVNGRSVVEAPRDPRILLPSLPSGDPSEREELWRRAIAQARQCLGAAPSSPAEEQEQISLSLDLPSSDLDLRADGPLAAPQGAGFGPLAFTGHPPGQTGEELPLSLDL